MGEGGADGVTQEEDDPEEENPDEEEGQDRQRAVDAVVVQHVGGNPSVAALHQGEESHRADGGEKGGANPDALSRNELVDRVEDHQHHQVGDDPGRDASQVGNHRHGQCCDESRQGERPEDQDSQIGEEGADCPGVAALSPDPLHCRVHVPQELGGEDQEEDKAGAADDAAAHLGDGLPKIREKRVPRAAQQIS